MSSTPLPPSRYLTCDANEAVASVAYRLNELIAIYPITPSSTMAEQCDEWAAAGKPNLWGEVPRVVEMQSEGGVAGADALELNLYQLITDPYARGEKIEGDMLLTARDVVRSVKIPVAAKISAFHTAPANFALQLERAGAKGVVIFDRFYQPDFNLEDLEVQPHLKLSDSTELLLRLRWLAVMSPNMKGSLACTGGVHTTQDVIKALLAGAHTVQLVSVLLKQGPRVLTMLLEGLRHWMEEHEYQNLDELRGALNLKRCSDPEAPERANYIRILQSWRV